MDNAYPISGSERDEWILARRPSREALDPERPNGFFVEEECSHTREIVSVATVLLTNRECPWRCLMCDLWRNTLTESVPVGAIPAQIDFALLRLAAARQIKLYNSGSFFDPRAIPVSDYVAIAERVKSFERVIVESHPAFIGQNCFRFRDLLSGRLEVAVGLETAHPEVLAKLNKRMTLDQFSGAARRLREQDVDLRVFVLVQPPFMKENEALHWAERSLDFAFECGAGVVTLIPTRAGNGAMETLQRQGEFAPPRLELLEAALLYGLGLGRGRVFADLWGCPDPRVARLSGMNLSQRGSR